MLFCCAAVRLFRCVVFASFVYFGMCVNVFVCLLFGLCCCYGVCVCLLVVCCVCVRCFLFAFWMFDCVCFLDMVVCLCVPYVVVSVVVRLFRCVVFASFLYCGMCVN